MFKQEGYKIIAYNHPIDMRKSFNGLLVEVKERVKAEPYSESLFLFFNKRRNYLKILYWDRTGYCIVAKKLESGKVFLPSFDLIQKLNREQLKLIMDGIPLSKRQ